MSSTTQKHTPGPWMWTLEIGSNGTVSGRELHPAAYNAGEGDSILYHGADWPMKEAAAYLIAAAPDLLAALQIAWQRGANHERMEWDEINQARAAINRAFGCACHPDVGFPCEQCKPE